MTNTLLARLTPVALLVFCVGKVSWGAPIVIDFNGLGVSDDNPVSVAGYEFTYSGMNGWAIGNETNLSNQVGNGTDFITARDVTDRESLIRMTRSNGQAFSLLSFDGADGLRNTGGRSIAVTGFLSGDRTVVEEFKTIANTFTTYTLPPSFANLTVVEFRNFGGFQSGEDGFALDNITVNPVPLPSSISFCGPGVLGLLLLRTGRRRG